MLSAHSALVQVLCGPPTLLMKGWQAYSTLTAAPFHALHICDAEESENDDVQAAPTIPEVILL